MKNKFALIIAGSALFGSLLVGAPAFAQTTAPQGGPQSGHFGGMPGRGAMNMKPGVFGTVSTINGDTLTVTSSKWGPKNTSGAATTTVTYTIDASNATVFKDNATSTLSSVAIGDMVMVQGTVSGTSVTATTIRDGLMPRMQGGTSGPKTKPVTIQGNGEPVVGGTVAAVSGDTLTVTNKSNVTYTVDASSAVVVKSNATSSVSAIVVGDNVVVQGTVNGNSVTASSVMDSGTAPSANSGSNGKPQGFGGVMGAIGGFFQHLFGFF